MKNGFRLLLLGFIAISIFLGGKNLKGKEIKSEENLFIINTTKGYRFYIPLNGVKRISIKFFHSYDMQWVKETFYIAKKSFVPFEVIYYSDTYDFRDTRYNSKIEIKKDRIRLYEIKPKKSDILNKIILRIAYMRTQKLILTKDIVETDYSFYQWGSPGDQIILMIRGK